MKRKNAFCLFFRGGLYSYKKLVFLSSKSCSGSSIVTVVVTMAVTVIVTVVVTVVVTMVVTVVVV